MDDLASLVDTILAHYLCISLRLQMGTVQAVGVWERTVFSGKGHEMGIRSSEDADDSTTPCHLRHREGAHLLEPG